MKILLAVLLGMVLLSLFSGLYFMYKDKGKSRRVVTALTIRIGLSVLIIVIVIFGYFSGMLLPK